jgi:hypothetical protein
MTYEDFEKSMDRILAFYSTPKRLDGREELTRYMQALYQSVKRINAAEFERVCQIVSDELSPIKKPVPAQFHSAYSRIKPNLMQPEQPEGSPEMTREESDKWIMQSAQNVIKQGGEAKLQWSPHVMKALLEQAGKPPQALPEPSTAYEVEDAEDAAQIQDTLAPLPPVSSRPVKLKITSRESAKPTPNEDIPF